MAAFILERSAALCTPSAPTAHLLGRQRITRVKDEAPRGGRAIYGDVRAVGCSSEEPRGLPSGAIHLEASLNIALDPWRRCVSGLLDS